MTVVASGGSVAAVTGVGEVRLHRGDEVWSGVAELSGQRSPERLEYRVSNGPSWPAAEAVTVEVELLTTTGAVSARLDDVPIRVVE